MSLLGCTLMSLVVGGTRMSQRQTDLYVSVHVLLFIITNISLVCSINYIMCLWDYDIRETLFFVLMETSWQYAVSVRRYVYCHVLLFIMANILFVYLINFILFLCHHKIRKQIFCFSIEGFLAVNWCCLSLEGPAYYRLLPSLE